MAITDLLTQATTSSRATPTQVTVLRVPGGTTLSCNVLTGWPTTPGTIHFCTYKIDTSGNKIAGSQIDMKGVVSGTTITQIIIKAGTDVGNAVGDIVEAAPTAAWANDLYTWGTAHANQDGSLLTSAVQTALSLGTGALNGWNVLAVNPNTVTANGNGSYSLVFNSTDQTATLSPGMRFRTTRTVAAPTQSTSLNGTTQFYSKTSPAGMTFTNNFVAGAWVKYTGYALGTVSSRYNGTSGWALDVNASGQVELVGWNAGASNFSLVSSYQSLPLNKWVHITAQLDMVTFTASTTTSYVMINGLDVPAFVSRGGTNPTALVQAGNLEIGSRNAGTTPFPGKIAQAFVYSAKVTQATIQTTISQGLAGTETNLISAYSFNGVITDLNTTSANNLTANGSAVATNADSPFGGQAGGTISSTLDYGIIQSATFSTNTTVVVQVSEGCTIPTSGGVSAVGYSTNAYPYGFPSDNRILGLSKVPNFVTNAAAVDVDISGLTTTVYVPAGRTIEIQVGTLIYSTAGGDSIKISLYEDGVFAESFSRIADGNSYYDFITYEFTRTPTVGSHTYKLMFQRAGGTGTTRTGGESATDPGFIKVRLAN